MIRLTSTISGISEMELVDSCISDIAEHGAAEALEKLYSCTKDSIYGYALSMLKNTQDAEDVLHDCYVTVWQSAPDYVSRGKPMAWLFTITRNLCMSRLRSRQRFTDLPEEDWERCLELKANTDPDDRLLLGLCLKELSDEDREILLLHVLSGLRFREIADITGRPLSTVLSKYHRTLKKLRKRLAVEETDDE